MSRSKAQLPIHEDEAGTLPAARHASVPDDAARRVIDLDVVSDVVCPWCYVGKLRLEKAIAMLSPRIRVNVVWRPYELNPWLPPDGMDRQEYRAAKFGSIERSRTLDARLTAAGAVEGIAFDFEKIQRTPNTRQAHRLLGLARRLGKQDAVAEALFRAFFIEGLDVGDLDMLVAIARAAGLDPNQVIAVLSGDEGRAEVQAEEDRFRALDIDGVPSFVVNGQVIFSGAGDPRLLADAIETSTQRA
ncbi:MAG TPA: DsbA family oxidoreductase [Tepidisphaeraceae bacterium]